MYKEYKYTYDIHENFPILKTPLPPPLLSIYIENISTPLTLNTQFQTTPLPPPPPPLQMITNQLKKT